MVTWFWQKKRKDSGETKKGDKKTGEKKPDTQKKQ